MERDRPGLIVLDCRKEMVKLLCEASKEGKEYLAKAGDAIGYANSAAAVTRIAAGVLTAAAPAAGEQHGEPTLRSQEP